MRPAVYCFNHYFLTCYASHTDNDNEYIGGIIKIIIYYY